MYLARGEGKAYRRHMIAYAETGCPDNQQIEQITDRDPAGPCVDVNVAALGTPGAIENQGRIMSVKFVSF